MAATTLPGACGVDLRTLAAAEDPAISPFHTVNGVYEAHVTDCCRLSTNGHLVKVDNDAAKESLLELPAFRSSSDMVGRQKTVRSGLPACQNCCHNASFRRRCLEFERLPRTLKKKYRLDMRTDGNSANGPHCPRTSPAEGRISLAEHISNNDED
eukprot:scaffold165829_cov32-Prasinocladus_malaysianus.AAC.2